MTSRLAVRFSGKHPLFGRKTKLDPDASTIRKTATGVPFGESPYFFWWRALRLSLNYRDVCAKKGKDCSKKWERLYRTFGDVHASPIFHRWWRERGERLFGEPASVPKVTLIDIEKQLLVGISREQTMVIAIPRHLSKRAIAIAVRQIVKKEHAGKRGRSDVATRHASSEAQYKLQHYKSIAVIKHVLDIVEARRKKTKLKDLQRAGEDITTVSRFERMGKTLIAQVELGKFPVMRAKL